MAPLEYAGAESLAGALGRWPRALRPFTPRSALRPHERDLRPHGKAVDPNHFRASLIHGLDSAYLRPTMREHPGSKYSPFDSTAIMSKS